MPRWDSICLSLALMVALLPFAARAERPPDVAPSPPPQLPSEPSDCDHRLSETAKFTRLPAAVGPGECGGDDLVRLEAVRMPGGSRVLLMPPAILRCSMAEGVAAFVRGEFHLTMPDGTTPHGLFTLVFRKFPDGWKIVHDHSAGE